MENREEANRKIREYFRMKRRTDPEWREKERIRAKEKYYKNKVKYNIRMKRIAKSKEHIARVGVSHAIQSGILKKPNTCENCHKQCKPQAHHFMGYDNPLKVMWLCNLCHGAMHHH